MDKLYSKQSLIYKAVFSMMLAPLYALISFVLNVEDGFLHILISIVPIGCLYTIPFWFSLVFVKKHRVQGIGKYILLDVFITLIPAIFGILLLEIITAVVNGSTIADGFATVIFTFMFLAVSAVFWIFYFVFSRIK